MSVDLYIWYINIAPIICRVPRIFSALIKRSAIKPMINGAMMAPQDCVEKTWPICAPLAERLLERKVPSVTNHPPQIKKFKNIMTDNCNRVVAFMRKRLWWFFGERVNET